MRIANVLGRGIEGAGVTRFAAELDSYIKYKTEHNIDTFALIDHRWPREKMQKHEFITMKIKDMNLLEFIKNLNTYDAVIFNSVPAKKNFSKQAHEYFAAIVDGTIKSKKFSIQNDHKKASLNRNINIYDFNDKMDGIFTFSLDSAFARALKERNPEIKKKLIIFRNGMNFDAFNNLMQPIVSQKKRISYFGRFATFKDPWRLIHFHSYIKKYKFITELIGIERSMGSFDFLNKNKDKLYDYSNKKFAKISKRKQSLKKPYVYGPYIREDGLKHIAESMFGASFFNITSEKESHGNLLEYAQLEMIAVGAIPVYDYDWSRNTKTIGGCLYGDIPGFGLFLKKDLSNADDVAFLMNEIAGDKKLATRYCCTAYQTAYQNFADIFAFEEFLHNIETRL